MALGFLHRTGKRTLLSGTMIAECVVDPEMMAEWSHFQNLHADFGVGQGRLLCEFPSKWRKKVLEAVQKLEAEGRNTSLQTQKMIDHFQHGSFRRSLVASCREFPDGLSWPDAARSVKIPFDVILHREQPESTSELRCSDFLKTDAPFHRVRQVEVRRTAEELVDCGWQCFRRAKEIIIVDPYFRPNDADFGKVLGHFLKRMEREASPPKRLEVHTELPKHYDDRIQRNNWNHWALEHLPNGWKLKVIHGDVLESGGTLHARYILTDFGGLDYNWGTDEDPAEKTQVSLLDDAFWKILYDRFVWTEDRVPRDFLNHPERLIEVIG